MPALTCTLVADGSSDRVLVPLLEMLLDEHCPGPYRSPHFVELPAGLPLTDRIEQALDLYPCDLLFVHRDAEKAAPATRADEIQQALTRFAHCPAAVMVIPVRMTESWLLVDEKAIRTASGNPSGKAALNLPGLAKIEALPDPKEVLFEALRTASELAPNRLRKFNPEEKRHRVTDLMDSLDRLRRLPSFQHLEHQIQQHFAA
jgi:hypothetical protein